jgi:Tfp pilus assembly protein PilX
MSRRLRLGNDDGIALVMALGIMLVLSITLTSVIFFTSSTSRDASSTKSGQTAYALAEAGVNNAASQIASHYYDSSNSPNNTTIAGSSAWTASGSQQSPSNTSACTTSSTCMTWSATWTPAGARPLGVGRGTWTITSTARVGNPTGPGASPVTRTLQANVGVQAPPEEVPSPSVWDYVYSGKGPTNGCDMALDQQVTFTSPLYVAGNLCLTSGGAVEAPGTVVVGGWFDRGQNGYLGQTPGGGTAGPLPTMTIVKSCDNLRTATPCALTQQTVNGQQVWSNQTYNGNGTVRKNGTIWATTFSNAIASPISPPAIDFDARYLESSPSSCTTSPTQSPQLALDGNIVAPNFANGDAGTFNLAPNFSYTCTTPSGSLAWNASSSTLTINGNIYVDGNLATSNNASLTYSGSGAIYVTGTATFGNNTYICATSVGGGSCSDPWDPSQEMLLIVAQSDVNGQNLRGFQGGIYSGTKIDVGGGHSNVEGPLVTPGEILPGQQAGSTFPDLTLIMSGAPGAPPPHYVLTNVYNNH